MQTAAFPLDQYSEFPRNEELLQWGRVSEGLLFTGLDVDVYACYLDVLGAWHPDKNPDEQPFTMAMHARMHPAHTSPCVKRCRRADSNTSLPASTYMQRSQRLAPMADPNSEVSCQMRFPRRECSSSGCGGTLGACDREGGM